MASGMKRAAQRAALLELGAAVAEEMKAGQGGDGGRTVADILAMMPQATLEVMALIEKEARKKCPDRYLVAALAYMAGQALELLRYGVERADPAAEATLGEARERLVAHARSDRADPHVLMLLAKQFASAKLDIGDTLRDAMGRMIAEEAAEVEDVGGGEHDMEQHLAELGEVFGDDPFAIHTELAETASSFPTEHRLAMAGFMLRSDLGRVKGRVARRAFRAAGPQQPGPGCRTGFPPPMRLSPGWAAAVTDVWPHPKTGRRPTDRAAGAEDAACPVR